MDFMELYAQKRMTAAQAAALVKSGDWVDCFHGYVNTPVAVDAELVSACRSWKVNFRGGILMWVREIFRDDLSLLPT